SHSHHHTPHLHSFPTRRSSDLSSAQERIRPIDRVETTFHQGTKVHAAVPPGKPHSGRPPGSQGASAGQPPPARGLLAQGVLRTTDRKSTRLNSSHDQISYAVFC